MNRIEINGVALRKFINYMADIQYTQSVDIKEFIVFYMKNKKQKCSLHPGYGKFDWNHNGEVFKIEFFEEGSVQVCEGLEYFKRMYIYHDDLNKIKSFLNDVFNYVESMDEEGKIKLYISKCGYGSAWERYDGLNSQSFDNIFIDKKIKENITNYIDKFISSKERYNKYGRIYKTNILLAGIPGSGKTSLCKALARKYGYSIYIMNFNKTMTDSHIIDLINDVRENSIILYEDIDSYFSQRTSTTDVNVSFSCFINILDGTLSKDAGIINIITTNFPDKLDSALLRPGRIDKIINFDYPKKEEIKEAFISLIGSDDKFDSFYNKIKHLKISMAFIIDYLFRYTDDYLENISELITQYNCIQQFTKEETTTKLYS
jgi:chaperone BCS1